MSEIEIGNWRELPNGGILLEVVLPTQGMCELEINKSWEDIDDAEYEVISSEIPGQDLPPGQQT